MEKKANFYVIFHKDLTYGVWDDELWTPLEVGSYYHPERILENGVRDNDCQDNISIWNPTFLENTGTYWIWKNADCSKKYTGQCQYRRRFDFHKIEEIDEIFSTNDVIACQPLNFIITVRQQYEICHSKEDIALMEKIVKELYPDYAESWDRYINNGRTLFYSNGFILRTPDFIKYCEWLFSILFEFQKRMGWETLDDHKKYIAEQMKAGLRPNNNGYGKPEGAEFYQGEICAFLSERLWTLYLQHNYDKSRIFMAPYLKMEPNI